MPALERLKDKPLTKRLVYAIVEQHSNANLPWGGEPIVHNDDIVGTVTSVSYNFKLEKPLCMGYLQSKGEHINSSFLKDKSFDILIAGKRFPLNLKLHKLI